MVSRLSWLRTCKMALAVLPSTLAPSSTMLSSSLTLVCVTGTVPVRPEASRSLKSDKPSQPMERQNRMTVGWLTPESLAISEMGSLRTARGRASTWSATRCSAGVSLGLARRICPRMAAPGLAWSLRSCDSKMAEAPLNVACSAVMT